MRKSCPFRQSEPCEKECALSREDGCALADRQEVSVVAVPSELWAVVKWDDGSKESGRVLLIQTITFTKTYFLEDMKKGTLRLEDDEDPWISTRYFIPSLACAGNVGQNWLSENYVEALVFSYEAAKSMIERGLGNPNTLFETKETKNG